MVGLPQPAGLKFRRANSILGIIRDSSQLPSTTTRYNENLPTLTFRYEPPRCSLGMLIVCKNNTTKTLNSLLQTLDETTYLGVLKTHTKCSSNNGGIAHPISQEKQHNNVLYTQYNIRDCSIFVWFCADVQNGALPTSPHLSRKLIAPDLPNNWLGRPTHKSPRP
jgi:hypothetical protein